jgi:hypothetical protein
MLLSDAIQRAAKFVAKKRGAPAILRALRFIPSYQGQPARIFATDGLSGIIVDVGQELPNMVLPVEPLVKLCRSITGIVAIEDKGNALGVVTVAGKVARDQSIYTLQGLPVSEFPGFPAIPEKFTRLTTYQWAAIQKVVHAASTDDAKPILTNVCFRSTAIEAVNRWLFARANISGPWQGLVPARLFQVWPEAGECAFTEHYCFWKMAEELRFAVLQPVSSYPDLSKLIPEEHDGCWMAVHRMPLIEAVKKAADMSPVGSVFLHFGPRGLRVRTDAPEGTDFEVELNAVLGIPIGQIAHYVAVLLRGKFLLQALQAMDTPRVTLCYGKSSEDPLRMESGCLVEYLWHMNPT